MLRALVHEPAWQMDTRGAFAVSDKVSMCNYWANRLCCEAATCDAVFQAGWAAPGTRRSSRAAHLHHHRCRDHRGRGGDPDARVAGYVFGFMKQRAPKGVADEGRPHESGQAR